MSVILGLNTLHAGASAAIVIDGRPEVAIAEERLNRVKYYARFPRLAVRECLRIAGLRFRDIDFVAVGRDSAANRAKKIEYVLTHPSQLLNLMQLRTSRSALEDLRTEIARECEVDPADLRFEQYNVEHHLAHIASAYYISDWDHAAGFSADGSGDFVTCMLAECRGSDIEVKQRVYVPHSLGSLYTMVCQFIGYSKFGDEGKVMGLAPYGGPTYADVFANLLRCTDDSVRLNPDFFLPFGAGQGLMIDENGAMEVQRHYTDRMMELFGAPREPNTELTQRDFDLAFGVQQVFEKGYMHLLRVLHARVPTERVAMAGGCALNSVANGKVFDETPFRETCIQPAAGDEGLALGAALYVSQAVLKDGPRCPLDHAYLGPEYDEAAIRAELDAQGVAYVRLERQALLEQTADEIVKGNVVGWFQGRMEWGPRALGNRSIVVHPGLPNMKDVLNARIKRREWFRPFAPSVLAERQADVFEHSHPSPFMLHVYKIRPEWRGRLVAVNHVDDTGRLQSVTGDQNPLYYDLIKAFEQRTGIPVVLNTSFNENEPIVCSPRDAVECFLRTKMDALAIGPFLCRKPDTPA